MKKTEKSEEIEEVKVRKTNKEEPVKEEKKAEKVEDKKTKKAEKVEEDNKEGKDKVKEIIEKAKSNGKITYGELATQLDEANVEQIDKVFDAFEDFGVDILQEDFEEPDIED